MSEGAYGLRTGRALSDEEETFSRLIASGESASDSYRLAFPDRTDNAASIWAHASVMRSRLGHRITFHQRQIQARRDAVGHDSIASKLELEQFATRALRAPLALTPEESDLIQEITTTTRECEDGSTILKKTVKVPAKGDMMTQLAKLAGHYAPAQLEVKATAVSSVFASVRGNNHALDDAGEVIECVTEDYSALLD